VTVGAKRKRDKVDGRDERGRHIQKHKTPSTKVYAPQCKTRRTLLGIDVIVDDDGQEHEEMLGVARGCRGDRFRVFYKSKPSDEGRGRYIFVSETYASCLDIRTS